TADPSMTPSGTRNYTRVIATDDRQITADATLAHQLGVKRPFIVQELPQVGGDYLHFLVTRFAAAAAANDLTVAGSATWVPGKPNYDAIVAQAKRSHADGVFLAGFLDPGVKTLVTSLRAGLGRKVPMISSDTFLPISQVLGAIGPAALGIYV